MSTFHKFLTSKQVAIICFIKLRNLKSQANATVKKELRAFKLVSEIFLESDLDYFDVGDFWNAELSSSAPQSGLFCVNLNVPVVTATEAFYSQVTSQ